MEGKSRNNKEDFQKMDRDLPIKIEKIEIDYQINIDF